VLAQHCRAPTRHDLLCVVILSEPQSKTCRGAACCALCPRDLLCVVILSEAKDLSRNLHRNCRPCILREFRLRPLVPSAPIPDRISRNHPIPRTVPQRDPDLAGTKAIATTTAPSHRGAHDQKSSRRLQSAIRKRQKPGRPLQIQSRRPKTSAPSRIFQT
jgi:hypothetical protein